MNMKRNLEQGFTLVEMMTVSVITGILVAMIFAFTVTYLQNASLSQSDNIAFVDRMNVSDYLRENIGISSGLMGQPRIADSHVPDGLKDSSNSQYWREIYPVKDLQINASAADINPILYFRQFAHNSSGEMVTNGSEKYNDNYVLYLQRDGKLRVRTIANPNVPDNRLKSTCPDDQVTSDCPADKTLMEDVDWIKPRYFSRSGLVVDHTSIDADNNSPCTSPPPDYDDCAGGEFPIAEVMELTIHISKRPDALHKNATQSSTIVRVALRNATR